MNEIRFIIPIAPITKKNSQQIRWRWGKDKRTGNPKQVPYIAPSEAYERYEKEVGWYIIGNLRKFNISSPVNIKCLYYMPTKRRVDLTNLLEATDDVLVNYGVLADDSSNIVASHDGSRVLYDKENPRTEVTISFYGSTVT